MHTYIRTYIHTVHTGTWSNYVVTELDNEKWAATLLIPICSVKVHTLCLQAGEFVWKLTEIRTYNQYVLYIQKKTAYTFQYWGYINLQMIETYNKCVKHVWLHTHVGASVHKLFYTHGSGHKMNKCSITSMANDEKLIHKSLDTTYSYITTHIDMQYYVWQLL